MYAAITRAWLRSSSREQRRLHPLGPYVLGEDFAGSVARAPVEGRVVASTCAKLAAQGPWERDGGESLPLAQQPWAYLDPLSSWWCPLGHSDDLGVHYDETAAGTLEFLSVGARADRPCDGGHR